MAADSLDFGKRISGLPLSTLLFAFMLSLLYGLILRMTGMGSQAPALQGNAFPPSGAETYHFEKKQKDELSGYEKRSRKSKD